MNESNLICQTHWSSKIWFVEHLFWNRKWLILSQWLAVTSNGNPACDESKTHSPQCVTLQHRFSTMSISVKMQSFDLNQFQLSWLTVTTIKSWIELHMTLTTDRVENWFTTHTESRTMLHCLQCRWKGPVNQIKAQCVLQVSHWIMSHTIGQSSQTMLHCCVDESVNHVTQLDNHHKQWRRCIVVSIFHSSSQPLTTQIN